ncbi:MAG: acyl-ACP desaturase [Bacteroidetes bacterium]|jgi:acyl-[acyl-carrier-protein] desaturase|nr:acyl-ACP desaturase [Bacteroidota bacterium]HMT36504.1 acyl-ACP desaturase [Chitinophagaceae bacterium]MBK6818761.1 acyl-ACP desaturase [Bacteroidota bacterium]MBK7040024.1 acyl-ACP desaturase [Bacteroidota bacterium]MBK8330210.1 acyl-ACP desaturase [Bacteroidota bacterium]
MNQALTPSRQEVMLFLEKEIDEKGSTYLSPIETNWQPGDLLPATNSETFMDSLKDIQGQAENMSYDLLAVLVGDTITEEALPTYETWLGALDGVKTNLKSGWMKWIRAWTAEENRHGDLLNRYLYLSGRIDMPKFEASTQFLIADGFDLDTNNDPYRTFCYTSFQELATNISHRRVATLSKKCGNTILSKICGLIAADEARHANAYKTFIARIFEIDTNEMMLAFEDMMRKKIVMPAQCMRELGGQVNTFANFSDAAQRLGVYTATDYVNIMKSLLNDWKIESMVGLKENGEKARDYLMKLPDRLTKISERMVIPERELKFSWIIS